MDTVWNFYGPWMKLMLQIGVPLVLLATPAMFLFERGSLPRRMVGKAAAFGGTLILLAGMLYFLIRIFQSAFESLPG